MAFCGNCGNKIDGGVKFCPSCGASVSDDTAKAVKTASKKAAAAVETAAVSESKTATVSESRTAAPAGKKAKGVSAGKILSATKSFVVVRTLAYIAILVAMLITGIIGILICGFFVNMGMNSGAAIVFVIIFGGFFAFLRLVRRYFLYMIKAAHIEPKTDTRALSRMGRRK